MSAYEAPDRPTVRIDQIEFQGGGPEDGMRQAKVVVVNPGTDRITEVRICAEVCRALARDLEAAARWCES